MAFAKVNNEFPEPPRAGGLRPLVTALLQSDAALRPQSAEAVITTLDSLDLSDARPGPSPISSDPAQFVDSSTGTVLSTQPRERPAKADHTFLLVGLIAVAAVAIVVALLGTG